MIELLKLTFWLLEQLLVERNILVRRWRDSPVPPHIVVDHDTHVVSVSHRHNTVRCTRLRTFRCRFPLSLIEARRSIHPEHATLTDSLSVTLNGAHVDHEQIEVTPDSPDSAFIIFHDFASARLYLETSFVSYRDYQPARYVRRNGGASGTAVACYELAVRPEGDVRELSLDLTITGARIVDAPSVSARCTDDAMGLQAPQPLKIAQSRYSWRIQSPAKDVAYVISWATPPRHAPEEDEVPVQVTVQEPPTITPGEREGAGSEETRDALPALKKLVDEGLLRGTEEIQELRGRQVFVLWLRALWRYERAEMWRTVGALVGLCIMIRGCQSLGEVQTPQASQLDFWGVSLTTTDIGIVLILLGFVCFALSVLVRRRRAKSEAGDEAAGDVDSRSSSARP